ncbi:phage holin [Lactobacillus delbrueckii subsp. lactis]|uniref:phage holin n=1 Tax=Lactobacillus delbrueckii TaxID=1584 RepID=UPI001E41B8A2|nr:phage holin [Lactobacillus delbrueckii]MCD5515791.1 phage holin [Lactobacillus delbrueckii subsp. lactis]
MSMTDWFNLIIAIGTVSLAVVASVYVRLKAKIDTKTAAGKAFDVVGKLAVWAVNEAEHSQDGGAAKREFAAKLISDQLKAKGITGIDEKMVYGAVETAWKEAIENVK